LPAKESIESEPPAVGAVEGLGHVEADAVVLQVEGTGGKGPALGRETAPVPDA
jgi:hypothetical protein